LTPRSDELRALAQAIVDDLPPVVVEAVLTGSVARGMADEVSDVELLLVTEEQLDLDACFGLAHGVSLRTSGLLAAWQDRLRRVPEDAAAQRIEDAALTWGGFAPEGFLTIVRPGERLALVERLVDDATRVLAIVYAVNRAWQPTSKRVALRAASLAVKPERLAERIEEALTTPDPVHAALTMTELQADTVALAPPGPNVDRARRWLAEVAAILRRA
jgi:hypothetical protein